MNQFDSTAVRVASPSTTLRFFPDTGAVLGGLDLDAYLSTVGGRQIGTLIPDDFEQPYAMNTTAGIAWQVNGATSVNVDYVHAFADRQTGTTDVNLPASGKISATNPRPVATFSQVGMLQNFSRSWYDAIESEVCAFRQPGIVAGVLHAVSQLLTEWTSFQHAARSARRRARGYNPSDQRHNLTLAAPSLAVGRRAQWIPARQRLPIKAGRYRSRRGLGFNGRSAGGRADHGRS